MRAKDPWYSNGFIPRGLHTGYRESRYGINLLTIQWLVEYNGPNA